MTKKDEFIEYVQKLMDGQKEPIEMTENVKVYWEAFLGDKSTHRVILTDNGKIILKYLQDLPENSPMLKAKDIAEGIYLSSRAVSGSMRKLVSDGFVEKVGQDPVMYSLTEKGKDFKIIDENEEE